MHDNCKNWFVRYVCFIFSTTCDWFIRINRRYNLWSMFADYRIKIKCFDFDHPMKIQWFFDMLILYVPKWTITQGLGSRKHERTLKGALCLSQPMSSSVALMYVLFIRISCRVEKCRQILYQEKTMMTQWKKTVFRLIATIYIYHSIILNCNFSTINDSLREKRDMTKEMNVAKNQLGK